MSASSSKRVTLKEWIDDNEKLLTVTGVFAALTAFLAQLPTPQTPANATATKATIVLIPNVQYYVTFCSLIAFLLLLIEVWASFPDKTSDRLGLFRWVFLGMFAFLVIYFIQNYRPALLQFSTLIFLMLYAYPSHKAYDKYVMPPIRSRMAKSKWIYGAIGVSTYVTMIMLVFWLALKTSAYVTALIPP